MQYCLNYSDTRFCALKNKITQFPDGFRLNIMIFSLQVRSTLFISKKLR